MKWLCLSITFLLITAPLCLGQSATPAAVESRETKTLWPGTTFRISQVKRLDANNVLMAVKVTTDETAPDVTFLGFWPDGKSNANEPPLPKGLKSPPHPDPFSLLSSTVTDEATKVSITAISPTIAPGRPFYGPSEIIATLNPRCWLQMSVQFKLPVPPLGPDGKIPVQKVDVTLPRAKAPIKGVIVPAL